MVEEVRAILESRYRSMLERRNAVNESNRCKGSTLRLIITSYHLPLLSRIHDGLLLISCDRTFVVDLDRVVLSLK